MKLSSETNEMCSKKNWLVSVLTCCYQLAGRSESQFECDMQRLLSQATGNIGYDDGLVVLLERKTPNIAKVYSFGDTDNKTKFEFYTQIISDFQNLEDFPKDHASTWIELNYFIDKLGEKHKFFKQIFNLINSTSFIIKSLVDKQEVIGYIAFVSYQKDKNNFSSTWEKYYVEFIHALTEAIRLRNYIDEQKSCLQELETMNQELKNFTYVVSHELKRPIGMSRNYIQQSINEYDKNRASAKNALIKASQRLDSLNDLINRLLYYSSVSWSEGELVKIDLNEIVHKAVDNLNHKNNIQIFFDNKLPEIYFDRFLILQIFENLISNAIKYTDKPVKKIHIGSSYDHKHEMWVFSVKDNGIGIQQDDLNKIFNLFYKTECHGNETSTGVGLSLVKKIIETYEGQIWVESQVGEGSQFFFSLPA